MLKKILLHVRRQPVAFLALFVALGGTSYAAATLAKNSVGSKQIQKGAVKSPEVADGSLKSKDFKKGSLPEGPQGPQGIQGIQGPAGADGDATAAAVRLLRGTATTQAIATATPNVGLVFANTEYNNENLFTTGTEGTSGATTLIIPEDGVYAVSAEVIWVDPTISSPANTDNGTGTRSLFLNGPQPGGVRAASTVPGVVNSATRQVLATTERFSAGDAIFLTATQDSGVSLNIRGSQNQVHFSATKLSD